MDRVPPGWAFLARDLVEWIEDTSARVAAVEVALGLTTEGGGELQAFSGRLTVLERRLGLSP